MSPPAVSTTATCGRPPSSSGSCAGAGRPSTSLPTIRSSSPSAAPTSSALEAGEIADSYPLDEAGLAKVRAFFRVEETD